MNRTGRVIGMDPGSLITGWGVIDVDRGAVSHVAHGHIKGGNGSFEDRLLVIHNQLNDVIKRWNPSCASIEDVFVGKNSRSALKLGQARGVAVLSAKIAGLEVTEYPPKTIKQAVSGNGGASKKELQKVVRGILGINDQLQSDEGDGLAIAMCHGYSKVLCDRLPEAPRRRRRYKGRGLRTTG